MSFSTLIYGLPKVGKTTLASTAPAPILFIDAEAGGMKFVPMRKIAWNGQQQPPVADGTWDMAVCSADTFSRANMALRWLSGPHPFKAVVIDSLTELQNREKQAIDPSGNGGYDVWGALLLTTERFIDWARDFASESGVPVFMICGSKENEEGKAVPMLQGQAQHKLGFKVNTIGYLGIERDSDGYYRRLTLAPRPWCVAGSHAGAMLPEEWREPNLTAMVEHLDQAIESYTVQADTTGQGEIRT